MTRTKLSFASGLGLVVANMVGAGVFLSTGFMAQTMSPGLILTAWLVGALLAMCGAVTYGEVSRLVSGSGGEYRYVSTLIHPLLGNMAGWASLLLGFSAPIALDAIAAGAFAHSLHSPLSPVFVAAALVVVLTFIHSFHFQSSTRFQNVLVALKGVLLLGFVLVCLLYGSIEFPNWTPPKPAQNQFSELASSLFFVAFAFAGWNASTYAASEFENPKRDVPASMLFGSLLVGTFYLIVNYLFVANITPTQAQVVFGYDGFTALKNDSSQVTLAQAVIAKLLGDTASHMMSGILILLFISAMSAMTMLGPRVYSAMAKDGYLPEFFRSENEHPKRGTIWLQGLIALSLVFLSDLRSMLSSIGALLVFFSALTALGLLVSHFRKQFQVRPLALFTAFIYVVSSVWMLWVGSQMNPKLPFILLGISLVSLGFSVVKRRNPFG